MYVIYLFYSEKYWYLILFLQSVCAHEMFHVYLPVLHYINTRPFQYKTNANVASTSTVRNITAVFHIEINGAIIFQKKPS